MSENYQPIRPMEGVNKFIRESFRKPQWISLRRSRIEGVSQTQMNQGDPPSMSIEGLLLTPPDLRKPTIITALENSIYDWRTANGVSRDTGIPLKNVIETLEYLGESGIVVEANRRRKGSKEYITVYTTRKHYEEHEPPFYRFLSALAGKII